MKVCEYCGSENVYQIQMTNINTGTVMEPGVSEIYCAECDTDVNVEDSDEYERRAFENSYYAGDFRTEAEEWGYHVDPDQEDN